MKDLLASTERKVKDLTESLPAGCFSLHFSSAGEFLGARGALLHFSSAGEFLGARGALALIKRKTTDIRS